MADGKLFQIFLYFFVCISGGAPSGTDITYVAFNFSYIGYRLQLDPTGVICLLDVVQFCNLHPCSKWSVLLCRLV